MASRSTPPAEEPKKAPATKKTAVKKTTAKRSAKRSAPAKKAAPRKRTAVKKTAEPPPRPDLWERLDDESNPAWEAFVIYRDLGLFRSLTKAAREVGKDTSLLKGWSRRHSWVARCRAWDAEMDKIDRAEVVAARRQMRERHVELAKDIQERVAGVLDDLPPEAMVKVLADPANLIRWVDVATKVERAALDFDSAASPGDGRGGHGGGRAAASGNVPLTADDFEQLTDEEIRTQLMLLRRELDSELADLDALTDDDEQEVGAA